MHAHVNHDGAVATYCYRRHRFSNGDSRVLFFSSPYSVKTTSLTHTSNDLFDQIWRKGVPSGSLVQNFLTPTLQPPEISIVKCGFS